MSLPPTLNDIVRALAPLSDERGVPTAQHTLNLHIAFEFDSDRLHPQAIQLLQRLGNAMRHATLSGATFQLIGHTDAKGNASYNRALSLRRAKRIAAYLMQHHHIATHRLSVEGRGEAELATPLTPFAALNRRVEVIASYH